MSCNHLLSTVSLFIVLAPSAGHAALRTNRDADLTGASVPVVWDEIAAPSRAIAVALLGVRSRYSMINHTRAFTLRFICCQPKIILDHNL